MNKTRIMYHDTNQMRLVFWAKQFFKQENLRSNSEVQNKNIKFL